MARVIDLEGTAIPDRVFYYQVTQKQRRVKEFVRSSSRLFAKSFPDEATQALRRQVTRRDQIVRLRMRLKARQREGTPHAVSRSQILRKRLTS